MTTRPHCWLCGRSAAKWGPLIERRGMLAHAGCREDSDRATAAIVAAAPPPDQATLDRLAELLAPDPGGA
jgi:hypothetical protein